MFTQSSRLIMVIICVGFLALLGCSKTQDTAPETRVFGDPPVIVNPTATTETNAIATADFTNFFLASSGLCDDSPILLGPIIVESRYTEVTLEATVTDPDDPPPPSTETDILLVAASFVTDDGGGTPQEDSIVLFDDGSQVPFPFGQKDARGLQECAGIVNNRCACTKAFYDVTSNDATAGNDLFTRKFAFAPTSSLPPNQEGLYLDVIAKDRGQAASAAADIAGKTREFRFEAVDRNGNLTEASNRPSVTIGNGSISCSGDPCACCLMMGNEHPERDVADGGCVGLSGLMFDRLAPRRCEVGGGLIVRDPDKIYNLCDTNADCCSAGNVCDTNDPDADYDTGACLQSSFARRCFTGLCSGRPGCL